ncbi:hypothetical protein FTO70_08365 [Methanosarcina sp. KYL-1]|uniref:hypothetical protein n=1 Tax=Methanosarcina sp. KYL-1 TaxID=2602068 RepID=UPI00210125BF|nr:hypothetical protein [Methanosarcina sp. KYL-1]MCQ1535692.1 hypothetical protein [Methanosarcina sp. KYL-1]
MENSSHLLLANLTPKIFNFRFNAFVSGHAWKILSPIKTPVRTPLETPVKTGNESLEKKQLLISKNRSFPLNQETVLL